MLPNSVIQHRAKHFEVLLARELSLIKREHSQNLVIHQKLENSIRRANTQSLSPYRNKISTPFDNLDNEQSVSNQKYRLSFGASSLSSQNQINSDQFDDFSDDSLSYNTFRRRKYYTKHQHLPPVTRATVSNQQKRENKNQHWMASFKQSNSIKENINELFTILDEEKSKPKLSELTPLQKQVRSFLETLPKYQEVQHGFDSFAPASLYSNRASIAIR